MLEYFNKSNPTSLATPTSTQQLPNIVLGPQQAILLNSDNAATCGASAVANLGFSLSDTSGTLVIMKVENQSDGILIYRSQDRTSWTSATTGADIVKVPSNTADPQAVWYRKLADGLWQQAELNGCSILLNMIAPSTDPTFVHWANGQEPPVTFITAGSGGDSSDLIPQSDIGLATPLITELLPNPAEPQSDSEDEYIELYNPNDQPFDLSGFKLEIGTSTKHFYTFPSGTIIASKGFLAFFSADTGLSLINSSGQAWLLDPLGTIMNQTEPYGTAKDGQAWALANAAWRWTINPTPGSANVISEPLTTKTLSLGKTSAKSSSKVSTAKTKSAKTAAKKVKTASVKATQPVKSTAAGSNASPLHPGILAGIGAAALLYGLYEYRHDVANRFYKLRSNRAARADTRKNP